MLSPISVAPLSHCGDRGYGCRVCGLEKDTSLWEIGMESAPPLKAIVVQGSQCTLCGKRGLWPVITQRIPESQEG